MRALIVDDNEDMRRLVGLVLDLSGGVEIVEADDACPAAKVWLEEKPDVVILDYRLPTHNGLEIATWMLEQDPDARIVLFSSYLDDEALAQADQVGVRACVSKDRVHELPDLARAVARAA